MSLSERKGQEEIAAALMGKSHFDSTRHYNELALVVRNHTINIQNIKGSSKVRD